MLKIQFYKYLVENSQKATLNFYLKSRFSVKPSKFPIYFANNCSVKNKTYFSRKCTSFEEQKDTRYIRGNVYFDIIVFSCLWSTKSCLEFRNLFRSRGKGVLTDFNRKWGWFHGRDVLFPKNLGWRWKFQKTETVFCW